MHDSPDLDLEHFLSRAQVRRLLGVGQTTLERMVRDGRFPPPVRLGARRVAWPASDYDRWVEERKAERARA